MDVKKLKKVELHLHLDGSLRCETVSEILGYQVSLKAPDKCFDLKDYLNKFDIPISIMQTKNNLKRVCQELIEDLIKDNVIYAEIRFSPLLHTRKGLSLEEIVKTILNELKNSNLKTTLILCMMRNFPFEENKKIINLAYKYQLPIDLAGDEKRFPTKNYKKLFEIAKEKNIPFTIHSGEADGIESIKSAISFGTKRLGHGIRILESDSLIKEALEKNITLEICPTSNIQTNVIDIYKHHPIREIMNKGIKVTVNTDNNAISNITLSDEYQKLVNYFNFTKEEFYQVNVNAINASFLNNQEKKTLLNKLENYYK